VVDDVLIREVIDPNPFHHPAASRLPLLSRRGALFVGAKAPPFLFIADPDPGLRAGAI